jgi:hypothetical protein
VGAHSMGRVGAQLDGPRERTPVDA